MVGTAVFRIVVSSDSMKKATAMTQGSSRLLAAVGAGLDTDRKSLGASSVLAVASENGAAHVEGQCRSRRIDKSALLVNSY